MLKGFRARLYPNRKQEDLLKRTFGCCRVVYNHFLAERNRSYKEDGVSLTYNKTSALLTILKRDKDHLWLNEVDSMALQHFAILTTHTKTSSADGRSFRNSTQKVTKKLSEPGIKVMGFVL